MKSTKSLVIPAPEFCGPQFDDQCFMSFIWLHPGQAVTLRCYDGSSVNRE